MKKILNFIFLLISLSTIAQDKEKNIQLDNSRYLEDQLFVGVSYNLFISKPDGISLRGFSNTIFAGYLRDIPLNENRNTGIGIGLGYGRNVYYHNMKIINEDHETIFSDFAGIDDYDSNKFIFHSVDLPFEFRIRNSTKNENKFWRIYTGVKFSYVFFHKSEFNLNEIAQKYTHFEHMNKLQYGLTSSIGYGTWNAYFYYGLTNIFEDALFNNSEKLNIKSVRFGLIFYIL